MKRLAAGMALALAILSAPAQNTGRVPSGAAVRELLDPATGNRWLLERQSPGAPGRLLLAPPSLAGSVRSNAGAGTEPGIRAGEQVAVVAHTAVMDAELEGTALGPARAGTEFRVRLKIGGRVVRAIAIAPGRAQWMPESAAHEATP